MADFFKETGLNEIDPTNPLLCEECGGEYLHQEKIEIFERSEDSSHGLKVTTQNNGQCVLSQSMAENPSPRRQGVRIIFSCEFCPSDGDPCVGGKLTTVLEIIQHKGGTYLTSRKA